MLEAIYEVRVLSQGRWVLHQMIPLPALVDTTYTFLYHGTTTLGQMQGPRGETQTIEGSFTLKIEAYTPEEAFDQVEGLSSKEVAKCSSRIPEEALPEEDPDAVRRSSTAAATQAASLGPRYERMRTAFRRKVLLVEHGWTPDIHQPTVFISGDRQWVIDIHQVDFSPSQHVG